MDEVIIGRRQSARAGTKLRADLKIRNLRPGVGQEPKLQLMRERQIAFEALLLFWRFARTVARSSIANRLSALQVS